MPDDGDGHGPARGETQSDPEFHRQSLLTQGYWEDASGAIHPPSDVAADVLSDEEQSHGSGYPTEGEEGFWQDVDDNGWPPDVSPEPARMSGLAIAVLGLIPVVPFVGYRRSKSVSYQPDAKIPGLAIASLVLGLVPVVPFVGSILAIVFGRVARSQISAAEGRLRGMAMAVWGVALGILTIVVTVIVIGVVVHNHDVNASKTNFSYSVGYASGQQQETGGFINPPGTTAQSACSAMSSSGYNAAAFYAGCFNGWNSVNG